MSHVPSLSLPPSLPPSLPSFPLSSHLKGEQPPLQSPAHPVKMRFTEVLPCDAG